MLAATAAFTRVHSGLVLLWNFCWVSVFQLILSMPAFCKKTVSYVVTTNALEEMTVLTRNIFKHVCKMISTICTNKLVKCVF